jgi:FAD/FMN-containing dehydrogenase
LVIVVIIARPALHIARTIWSDPIKAVVARPGTLDDASHLNAASVREVWPVPGDEGQAEAQLAALLQRARTNHLKVSIAGARHSMGAHTIAEDGIVVDMLPFKRMELDESKKILQVQAGAVWRDVIRFLNARGLSVEIMQSNDDFSVGGSISVNCHGWQFGRPPIASSVESLRLMLADGSVRRCSRAENAELFYLALGGYGLFGIILEVELRVVANEHYRIERIGVTTKDYTSVLTQQIADDPNVAMVYGRLRVTPENFLQEGILNILRREPAAPPVITEFAPRKLTPLKRAIFRGGVGSDYGKQLRWDAERRIDPWLAGDLFQRNALLSDSATWFENRATNRTDILLECFVSPGQLESLLADLRRIIPRHRGDLLNVTVRHVAEDRDSFLRYATKEVMALVMLFNQSNDTAGELDMKTLTQEIIRCAIEHNGTYYLPYRTHATAEQFHQAYPQAKEFFALKRKYDPGELFENGFYRTYGK